MAFSFGCTDCPCLAESERLLVAKHNLNVPVTDPEATPSDLPKQQEAGTQGKMGCPSTLFWLVSLEAFMFLLKGVGSLLMLNILLGELMTVT